MNKRRYVILSVAMIFAMVSSNAVGQGTIKEQLVGTWKLVSAMVEREGQKVEPFGANPLGIFVFTSNGYFSWNFMRADRPKFASNNRQTGTPDENKAAIQGNISASARTRLIQTAH